MTDNFRFAAIAAFFAIAAVALWFLVGRDDDPENEARVVETSYDVAESPPGPNARFNSVDAPRSTRRTPTPRERTEGKTPFTRRERSTPNIGVIKGTVTAAAHTVPSDVTVTLRRITWKPHEPPDPDALILDQPMASDQSFEFTDLPLGDYLAEAWAGDLAWYSSPTLTRERPEREITISLRAVMPIDGIVLNPSREPLEGASVFFANYFGNGQTFPVSERAAQARMAVSGADGRFRLAYSDPRYPVQIGARHDEFATAYTEFVTGDQGPIEIVLKLPGTASGRVILADSGAPVPDFELTLKTESAFEKPTATTNDEGDFQFEKLAPGPKQLLASKDGLVPTETSARFAVQEGLETTDLLVELTPGGVISGRVYDVDSGQGISGIAITARPMGFDVPGEIEAQTGPGGAYKLSGLYPGRYDINRRAPEGYPSQANDSPEDQRAIAVLGEEVTGIDFPLARGIRLSGVVFDEENNALSGVRLSVNINNRNYYSSATTDQRGRFDFYGLHAGEEVQIYARQEGFARNNTHTIRIEAPVTETKIVLTQESTVSGTVVLPNGRPATDAVVMARHNEQQFGIIETASTSGDGSFKLEGLAAGEYQLSMRAGQNQGVWSTSDESLADRIALRPGQHLTGVRLVYDAKPSFSISGRVTDTRGQPIAGAVVESRWNGPRDNTDEQGRYKIDGFREGSSVELIARHSSYVTGQSSAEAGATNIDFILKGYGTIRGNVYEANSSRPVTAFDVNGDAFHDPEGAFELTNASEATRQIEVTAEGYAPETVPVEGVQEGQTLDNVIVRLKTGGRLRGTVTDSAGQPVVGAAIFVGQDRGLPLQYQSDSQARSDTGGNFSLDSLPHGEVTIAASHASYAPAYLTANVSPSLTRSLNIVMTSGATIEGAVTLDGQPVGGQYVSMHYPRGGNQQSGRTDQDGQYRLTKLTPGEVYVGVNLQSGVSTRRKSVNVFVSGDETLVVDFPFTSESGVIEGYVYRNPGEPESNAHLNLSINAETGTEMLGAQADRDGYYRIENVPAGSGRLRVYGSDRQAHAVSVQIDNGQQLRKDILLYSQYTVNLTFAGAPADSGIQVFALPANYSPPTLDQAATRQLHTDSVGNASTLTGSTALNITEPGEYTLLAIAYPRSGVPSDYIFPHTTTSLTIPDGQTTTSATLTF